MAGLLDQVASMFGFGAPQQQSAYGTSTGQPWDESSIPLPGYDPQAARRAQFSRALLEAGARIASAPRGQAVGQGLLGVLGGIDSGKQDYEQGLLSQMKWDQYRRDQQSQERQRAVLGSIFGGDGALGGSGADTATQMPPPFVGGVGRPAPALPQTAQAPSANAVSLPPNVLQAARLAYETGDSAGALKIVQDYQLNQNKPVALGEGGILVDPVTGRSIAENPKNFNPSPTMRPVGNNMEEPGYYDQQMQWHATGQAVPRWQTPQPTAFSAVNFKFPDGHYETFDSRDSASINKALAARAVQQNPPTTTNVVNVGPNGVDYGDPGKGLVWSRNPDGTVKLDDRGAPVAIPFQGGEVYQKQQADAGKTDTLNKQQTTAATIVTQDIDRATNLINSAPAWTTGYLGGWLQNVGGMTANDVRALLTTIKANAAFDRLQQMRNSSPTGGALGNVSEMELSTLQSAIGNLEQSQSKKQLLDNLARVKQIYSQIIDGPAAGQGAGGGSGSGNGNANSNDPLGLFQ